MTVYITAISFDLSWQSFAQGSSGGWWWVTKHPRTKVKMAIIPMEAVYFLQCTFSYHKKAQYLLGQVLPVCSPPEYMDFCYCWCEVRNCIFHTVWRHFGVAFCMSTKAQLRSGYLYMALFFNSLLRAFQGVISVLVAKIGKLLRVGKVRLWVVKSEWGLPAILVSYLYYS